MLGRGEPNHPRPTRVIAVMSWFDSSTRLQPHSSIGRAPHFDCGGSRFDPWWGCHTPLGHRRITCQMRGAPKPTQVSDITMKLVHRITDGPLPTSEFDLVNDAGEVIGYTQVRHRASRNPFMPPDAGNHVYYEISEAYRGRGYGKQLMGLALAEAGRIGLEAVRLTVRDDNPTSRHIIESHGATWLKEFVAANGVRYHLFEWSVHT